MLRLDRANNKTKATKSESFCVFFRYLGTEQRIADAENHQNGILISKINTRGSPRHESRSWRLKLLIYFFCVKLSMGNLSLKRSFPGVIRQRFYHKFINCIGNLFLWCLPSSALCFFLSFLLTFRLFSDTIPRKRRRERNFFWCVTFQSFPYNPDLYL